MTRNRRAITAVAATALALTALGACAADPGDSATDETATGSEPPAPVELTFTWWGDDRRAEGMENTIALFEEANPHVTINGSFSDYASYFEKRTTEGAAGNLPDILMFNMPYLRDYAERGLLLDLGTAGDALDVSGVDEATVLGGQVNGTQFGVPIGTNVMAVISNPLVYEATGVDLPSGDQTWDEFYDTLTAVSEAGGGEMWGADNTLSASWIFEMKLLQEGGALFTEDGELGFDEARLTEFWQEIADLGEQGALVPTAREDELAPQFALAAGVTGSRTAYDSTATQFIAEVTAPELVLSAPPRDPSGPSGLFSRPALLLVGGSNTEHPEVVAQFISFMVNDPDVGAIFGASRGIPVTDAQREAAQLEGLDQQIADYQASVADLLQPIPPAPPAGWSALDAHFNRIGLEIRLGTISVEDGVKQFFDEVAVAQG